MDSPMASFPRTVSVVGVTAEGHFQAELSSAVDTGLRRIVNVTPATLRSRAAGGGSAA